MREVERCFYASCTEENDDNSTRTIYRTHDETGLLPVQRRAKYQSCGRRKIAEFDADKSLGVIGANDIDDENDVPNDF